MKSMKIVTAAMMAAFAMPAFAQIASTPRIDQRQQNQQQRIDQGVQSGALNQREAARLQKGQTRVQNVENRVTADGTVTNKERRRVEKVQDRQSRRIAHQKRDRQVAK
jgi:hypothetical protein